MLKRKMDKEDQIVYQSFVNEIEAYDLRKTLIESSHICEVIKIINNVMQLLTYNGTQDLLKILSSFGWNGSEFSKTPINVNAIIESIYLYYEIANLKKENQDLKKTKSLKFKTTTDGKLAIVFGTYECRLYKNQWVKIIDHHDDLKKFIQDNDDYIE